MDQQPVSNTLAHFDGKLNNGIWVSFIAEYALFKSERIKGPQNIVDVPGISNP